jgi:ubiquinone/menaquinone biosynthesis C-methylase UbiE
MKTSEILDGKNEMLLRFISPKKKEKILVIGTGVYPKIERLLLEKFGCAEIVSGDLDLKNVNNAKKILPKLKFIQLNIQKKLPFAKSSFDKIIFTDVLEHLANEKIALKEINRVLKNEGALILSVPKRRWFSFLSPVTLFQHKREYSEKSLKKVLSLNGFMIQRIFVGGNIYNILNLWIHLFFKYFLRKLHPALFFQKRIDESSLPSFKGKGTDILAIAKKFSNLS